MNTDNIVNTMEFQIKTLCTHPTTIANGYPLLIKGQPPFTSTHEKKSNMEKIIVIQQHWHSDRERQHGLGVEQVLEEDEGEETDKEEELEERLEENECADEVDKDEQESDQNIVLKLEAELSSANVIDEHVAQVFIIPKS